MLNITNDYPQIIKSLKESHLFRPIDISFAALIYAMEIPEASETAAVFAAITSNELAKGHICIEPHAFAGTIKQNSDMPEAPPIEVPLFEKWIALLLKSRVIGVPGDFKPLIYDGTRLYLHKYYRYETFAALVLRDIINKEDEAVLPESENLAQILFEDDASGLQKEAAIKALKRKFSVIAGGPGTGKTTTVAKIVYTLLSSNKNLKIAIAAPTGKAAARMNEAVRNTKSVIEIALAQKKPAALDEEIFDIISKNTGKTIHRLLGIRKNTGVGEKNEPLFYDVVIIDESSMMDMALVSKLLSALKPESKLILLGDKNQLASVEAGSFFSDICDAAEKNEQLSKSVTTLTKSYRFEKIIGIGALAEFINQKKNKSENLTPRFNEIFLEHQNHLTYSQMPTAQKLKDFLRPIVLEGYQKYINAKDEASLISSFNQFKILCAVRKGAFGVEAINQLCEEILAEAGLISLEKQFYNYRPVMISTNDYPKGLFNGDVGIIFEKSVVFPGVNDENYKRVIPFLLPKHETVFAMTIHKSQGSEFDSVLIILPESENEIISKELLYTAITRAKKHIQIIASEKTLNFAMNNEIKRNSGLKTRLEQK